MTITRLTETVGGVIPPGGPPTPGVVRGVKLLGLASRKGRRYLPEAVAKAAPLYEGKAVYVDHRSPDALASPRNFVSKFGVLKGVRYVEGDGLRGDLHYNPRHILADTFAGWVETDPSQIGFSHDAFCQMREAANGDGREVVEIVRVESVDLVATPATTNGLFESEDSLDPLMPDTAVETPAGLDASIAALIAAILTDAALTAEEKKKKVLVACKLMDEAEEAAPVAEAETEEADDEKIEEAVGRILDKRLGDWLTEAIDARVKGVKAPVSLPPAGKAAKPALTVDSLMAELSGGAK